MHFLSNFMNKLLTQNSINEKFLNYFPNPANNYLYFNAEKQFEIFDLQEKILLHSENSVSSVNISHLNAGIYFVRFEDGNVTKFVKN